VHKVFSAELDLAVFALDLARPGGSDSDPYGPIRVVGVPRRECRVTIERAYENAAHGEGCSNPAFLQTGACLDR
jgi:hypothetical protein